MDFELSDLVPQPKRSSAAQITADARREHKRQLKLCALARKAEEMKFSHSIQFNAVPDWSSNYIAYSNLKKL